MEGAVRLPTPRRLGRPDLSLPSPNPGLERRSQHYFANAVAPDHRLAIQQGFEPIDIDQPLGRKPPLQQERTQRRQTGGEALREKHRDVALGSSQQAHGRQAIGKGRPGIGSIKLTERQDRRRDAQTGLDQRLGHQRMDQVGGAPPEAVAIGGLNIGQAADLDTLCRADAAMVGHPGMRRGYRHAVRQEARRRNAWRRASQGLGRPRHQRPDRCAGSPGQHRQGGRASRRLQVDRKGCRPPGLDGPSGRRRRRRPVR